MGVNKVVYGGNTLIDISGDTAVASDVAQGKTFHLANGQQATGTSSGGGLPDTITAGNTPVIVSATSLKDPPSSTRDFVDTGSSVTIPRTGTYRFKWTCGAEASCTLQTELHKNNAKVGSTLSFSTTYANGWNTVLQQDVACNAGDQIKLYLKTSKANYGYASMLVACINWDI